jgi:hypothetical protein
VPAISTLKTISDSVITTGGGVGVGAGLSPPLLHPIKAKTKKLKAMMLCFLIENFKYCINYNLTILN